MSVDLGDVTPSIIIVLGEHKRVRMGARDGCCDDFVLGVQNLGVSTAV